MITFFTQHIEKSTAYLHDSEHKHCSRVLRKKIGDSIHFVDGNGGRYEGIIEKLAKQETEISILHSTTEALHNPLVHMAIAPTKNMSRFEWFLEKATEIGIRQITPIITEHSERRTLKMERCQTILIAAMKQSLKAYLPILNNPISYKEFMDMEHEGDDRLIASYNSENINIGTRIAEKYCVLIGPEGDFSPAEIDLAKAKNWTPVNLSRFRLRTETAAIVACTLLNNR